MYMPPNHTWTALGVFYQGEGRGVTTLRRKFFLDTSSVVKVVYKRPSQSAAARTEQSELLPSRTITAVAKKS